MCSRWREPRSIVKAVNNNVYQEKDLRNGQVDNIQISRLKFYGDG